MDSHQLTAIGNIDAALTVFNTSGQTNGVLHLGSAEDDLLISVHTNDNLNIYASGLIETYDKNLINAVRKRDQIAVESFKYIQEKTKGLSF